MDEDKCRSVYLALRTAPASDIAVRGVAALRLMMIDAFGEDRQRELIGAWNDEELPRTNGNSAPLSVRRLAEEGIGALWIEAGMPKDMAGQLSNLFHTMFDLVYGAEEDDTDLLLQVEQRLRSSPPDFSNARIIANKVLARAMYEGNENRVKTAAKRVQDILSRWKRAEEDWGRDYELEKTLWIIEHADEITPWSRRVREKLQMIQRLDR